MKKCEEMWRNVKKTSPNDFNHVELPISGHLLGHRAKRFQASLCEGLTENKERRKYS